jgi:hypothetical protein
MIVEAGLSHFRLACTVSIPQPSENVTEDQARPGERVPVRETKGPTIDQAPTKTATDCYNPPVSQAHHW